MKRTCDGFSMTHERMVINIALEKYTAGFKNPKDKYYISECIVNIMTNKAELDDYCRIYGYKCSRTVSLSSNDFWESIEGILDILFGVNGVKRLEQIRDNKADVVDSTDMNYGKG